MKAPALSESKLVATTSSKIYDNKNELIADLGSERRVNAQANEIPTDLVKAIVSIEDHRFFDHRGVGYHSYHGCGIEKPPRERRAPRGFNLDSAID